MSAKKNTITAYKCSNCGHTQPKWGGHCPNCSLWNTFEEITLQNSGVPSKQENTISLPLSTIIPQDSERFYTGLSEFDRVLGGGAVKRSAIMIGGEPGIGKSTLLLQTAALSGKRTLYISGEESGGQIRSRADRLKLPLKNIEVLCTSKIEDAEFAMNKLNPVFVIIDSIQTMFSPEAGSIPGSINQLKYCANELISWVKERDSILFLTAHVTKEGTIAGPKVLEHLVDTVISFERNEDDIRFLRAQKNRFGSIDELGIFNMDENGLKAIEDPSSLFITTRKGNLPSGISIVPVIEGSRVFMVEIQALTVPAKAGLTRIFSDRIDSARVSRIAAVLEKKINLRFSDQDIYINVAGGIKLKEPAADLALALALYSARTDIAVQKKSAFIGELSLAGEIRPVNRLKPRVKTSNTLGFEKLYAPLSLDSDDNFTENNEIIVVDDLSTAIQKAFPN